MARQRNMPPADGQFRKALLAQQADRLGRTSSRTADGDKRPRRIEFCRAVHQFAQRHQDGTRDVSEQSAVLVLFPDIEDLDRLEMLLDPFRCDFPDTCEVEIERCPLRALVDDVLAIGPAAKKVGRNSDIHLPGVRQAKIVHVTAEIATQRDRHRAGDCGGVPHRHC